jgi:Rieske Fe-S protein
MPQLQSVHRSVNNELVSELLETRRRFYISMIFGLGAVIGGALSIPAFLYLFFPPRARKQAEWVDVADLSNLTVNKPEEVVFQINRADGWKITSVKATAWVVKKSDQQAIAFAPWCTHLACAYHWEEASGQFLCPCHASRFSIDGVVVSGPAPRPLDRYPTRIEGDKLQVGSVEMHA